MDRGIDVAPNALLRSFLVVAFTRLPLFCLFLLTYIFINNFCFPPPFPTSCMSSFRAVRRITILPPPRLSSSSAAMTTKVAQCPPISSSISKTGLTHLDAFRLAVSLRRASVRQANYFTIFSYGSFFFFFSSSHLYSPSTIRCQTLFLKTCWPVLLQSSMRCRMRFLSGCLLLFIRRFYVRTCGFCM